MKRLIQLKFEQFVYHCDTFTLRNTSGKLRQIFIDAKWVSIAEN